MDFKFFKYVRKTVNNQMQQSMETLGFHRFVSILRFAEDRAKQIRSPYEEEEKKQLILKYILFELYVCGYKHKHTHRITGEPMDMVLDFIELIY